MIKQICTDLETSKKLKELGFDITTNFYWTITNQNKDNFNKWDILYFNEPIMAKYEPTIKAYTLEQILNKLPLKIGGYGYNSIGVRYNSPHKPYCIGYNLENDEDYGVFYCDVLDNESMATTAAKLWIKLKESKII